ncbi:MAG: VCBS repeat-containing protein [Bacteroidetes bacterium]|nr:VCBS repeat-containing protein [Bacteroidota bacterium]
MFAKVINILLVGVIFLTYFPLVAVSQEIHSNDLMEPQFLDPTFVDINAGLIGTYNGASQWADFDNDGDLDLIITGNINGTQCTTAVYMNYNNTFSLMSTGLIGVSSGSLDCGDYDNDGDIDIVIVGNHMANRDTSIIYKNQGSFNFTDIGANIQGMGGYARCKWGDYDNDGDLDLILIGMDTESGGIHLTKLYRNDGNDIFTEVSTNITGLFASSVNWGDYDNDGDLDLIISGVDQVYAKHTIVYNNSGGIFTNIGFNFPGVSDGVVTWADYDNEGDLDILIVGSNSTGQLISGLFRNDGNDIFTEITTPIVGVDYAYISWGDYNNDGFIDIIVCGDDSFSGTNPITKLYRNDGSGNFVYESTSIAGLCSGRISWGDYDNDHDLDILINGHSGDNGGGIPYLLIYRNDGSIFNSLPEAPSSLSCVLDNGSVRLSWNKGNDIETGVNGLNYNVRIGSSPNGIDIRSPMAELSSGERLISKRGMINDTAWFIESLPDGTYYWSVQTIDNGYESSEFSNENSFVKGPQPCPGIENFSYGGQTYNTVLIGNQCWMKENLNIGTRINGNQNQTNNSVIEKYCYDNQETYCNEYGGLYQWNEMMQYTNDSAIQGICPDGWHIPTDSEWKVLEGFADSQYGIGDPVWNNIGYRGYDAGKNLKSYYGWNDMGNGIDLYGFSGLPGGYREDDGTFGALGNFNYSWSSSNFSSDEAWRRAMSYLHDDIYRSEYFKSFGFSLRCIKDTISLPPLKSEFKVSSNYGLHPLSVQFTDLSEGYPDGWEWDFQNDGIIDSYEQNPSFTYENPGYYSVFFKIKRGPDFDTLTKANYIIVYPDYDTCPGIPSLDYYGQTYNTVLIGKQCWIKENLNAGEMIPGSEGQTNNGTIEKYCFEDSEDNCTRYGGLYQWDELMSYAADTGVQGICPSGWHVPTDWEWLILVDYNGGSFEAGGKLKETGTYHWNPPNTGATNESGFSAFGNGHRQVSGTFVEIKDKAYYWSSLQSGASKAYNRQMANVDNDVMRGDDTKALGFSLRCIYNDLFNSYTIQTNSIPPSGGATFGNGTYIQGQDITIYATENPGYQFIHWKEADTIVTTQHEYTFTVNSDRTFYAHFEQLTYSITTSADPLTGGSTTGDGTYYYNDEVTVEATPEPDWNFLNWTENAVIVSSDELYTFYVTGSRTLVAHFTQELIYNVLLTPNPDSGGITIGSGNYTAGSNVSIKARPNDGWEFVNWTENSTVISSDTVYTFQINSDRVIEANFNQLSYDLSLNSVPPDGGNTVGEGTYYYDDQVEISAYPNEHWSFVNWKEADTVLSDLQSLTITIRADRTIDGIFQEDQKFDVSVTAQPQEGGMVLGDSSYYYGDYATVMANANQGWQFIEWQVGGTFVSSSQEYSFMVSESVNMVAVFESTGILSLVIENTGNDTICQGENILLQCLPSGGSPPFDFNWTSDPPGITGTSSEISVMPGVNTIYIVSVTDALLNFRSDSIEIMVKPSPPANIVGKGNPPYMIICVDSGYSYQWFFNDAILDGETKQFYYPGAQGLELGQYYVNVTNDEGCSAKSNIFERSAKSAFDIWPNPSTGEFYVSVSYDLIVANEEAQIRIVDLNGKILEEIIISSEMANKIIRHNFFVGKKGVFIAEFIGSNQRMAKKVIVY